MSVDNPIRTEEAFAEAFRHAEKVLKRFERIGGKALDTAINQLRYASRHYLEAQEAKDEAMRDEAMRKALSHCRRAEYDAIDASIAVIGSNIVDFDSRYLESSIVAIIPNYADSYAKATIILSKLSEEDSPRDVKATELSAYGAELDALVDIWIDIASKRPLVEKLDFEKRFEMRTASRRHIQNTLLSILAIAVAIALAIIFS
jgi:hypothetical protein